MSGTRASVRIVPLAPAYSTKAPLTLQIRRYLWYSCYKSPASGWYLMRWWLIQVVYWCVVAPAREPLLFLDANM